MNKVSFLLLAMLLPLVSLCQKYQFHEEFEDNRNGWNVETNDVYTSRLADSRYSFQSHAALQFYNMFLFRTPILLNPQKNYKIEMKASSGQGDSSIFGVRFNAGLPVYCLIDSSGSNMDDNNFYTDSSRRNTYAFVLRKDGYVSLYHYGMHRTYQRVMPWIKAKKVLPSDNIFSIVNNGNQFNFLLNGIKVFQKNIDLSRGFSDVGIIVNKDNSMSVDYLRVDEQ